MIAASPHLNPHSSDFDVSKSALLLYVQTSTMNKYLQQDYVPSFLRCVHGLLIPFRGVGVMVEILVLPHFFPFFFEIIHVL